MMNFSTLITISTLLFSVLGADDNDEPTSRIIGGAQAQRGKYNYMVHILINNNTSCGGSLIAKDTIVTAAHCIANNYPGSYNVRGNIHNIRQERGEQLKVTQVIRHPGFNGNSLENDIALLKIDPNHNINSLLKLDTSNAAQVNNQLRVTGWGRVVSMGQGSDTLKELDMKVLDPDVCSRNVTPLNAKTHFCATGIQQGSTACQGDSGSPVVSGDLSTIVGLVSYGSERCNMPSAAFTRISSFVDWIKQYSKVDAGNPSGNSGGSPGGNPDDGSYPKGTCNEAGSNICFSQNRIGICIDTRSAHPFECPKGTTCRLSGNGKAYCK